VAKLEELLGPAEDREARSRTLQDALKARAAAARAAGDADLADQGVRPAFADPRRPEIVGKLPIERIRADLGKLLTESQVVVVSGGTGSGKSTQLPQFLLDDWRGQDDAAVEPTAGAPRIVVTQPRRIAAISVAERVAWERGEQIGESVGYAVYGSAVRPKLSSGSVEFVTVGTLLRRAVSDPLLQRYDVVVVDEVHERDMLTDFLLILLRELMMQRPRLRLVLMSATMDMGSFADYFRSCPVLEVPTDTLYPVEEMYLEDKFFKNFKDTEFLLRFETLAREQAIEDREQYVTKWWGSDEQDTKILNLTLETIRNLVPEVSAMGPGNSILCFLPGWSEIRHLLEHLRDCPEAGQIWALPLHSMLPKEQQQQVFKRAPKGMIKVIIATNIAESSLTINDVAVVIDSGLQREQAYDSKRRMSTMDTVWVSQSNATQRKGRAGRVQAGKVLRLYTREQFRAVPLRPVPEIQRCDLAQSCLQAVALGRDPQRFLAEALDPPSKDAVQDAMDQLTAIKAVEGVEAPMLLPVGEVLSRLPLDPLLGRSAIVGSLLGVPRLTAALLVVSGGRSPFMLAQHSRAVTLKERKKLCGWSDVLAATKALLKWEHVREQSGEVSAGKWAETSLLNPGQLSTSARARQQLVGDMQRTGLLLRLPGSAPEPTAWLNLQAVDDEEKLPPWKQAQLDREPDDGQDDAAEPTAEGLDAGTPWEDYEALLASVLTSAYASNLALRPQRTDHFLRTHGIKNPIISGASVNNQKFINRHNQPTEEELAQMGPDRPTWWLYGDSQLQGNRTYLNNTTRVEEWQLGVFGGLTSKNVTIAEQPMLELDGWLTLRSSEPAEIRVMQELRRELNEAIQWLAIAAVDDDSAARAQAAGLRLRAAVGLLSGRAPDDAAREAAAPSEEEIADENVEQQLSAASLRLKKVTQLRNMCKLRDLKATGKKQELVNRLLSA